LGDKTSDARRECQRAIETAEKAKSELRSLLMTHLSLLEKAPVAANGALPVPPLIP
jgi:hypothetical protein